MFVLHYPLKASDCLGVLQEMSAMQLRQHHKEELRAQMAANEERQKRQHAEYLLEGEKTRQKLQAEKDFIEVNCLTPN